MKYQRIRDLVDAIQYVGNPSEVRGFLENHGVTRIYQYGDVLALPDYATRVEPGDYVVVNNGLLTVMPCGTFAACFEPYEE